MLFGNILFAVVVAAFITMVVAGIGAGICYLSELFFGEWK